MNAGGTGPLRPIEPATLADEARALRGGSLDATTLAAAGRIVEDVRARGDAALREHSERLGDILPGAPLVLERKELESAPEEIPAEESELLMRVRERIAAFARAQRAAIRELETDVPGGRAGHEIAPVARAGCYAPGGRFPLPSSVLMTVVTAREAGVAGVLVASPKPAPATRAAAAIAGADGLLACGGAQAIAALANGTESIPACDAVVGPGNRWVTAAKKLVAGEVAIDMLAGPSELLVLADGTADPAVVAADLIAQAEHDPDARPLLVTTAPWLVEAVNGEIDAQLHDLPTRGTAEQALVDNGRAAICADLDRAIELANQLAPEHLEVLVEDAVALRGRLTNYGGLFLGGHAAEVFGDYGVGPNHVLPTSGTARHSGGLSVFTFLRIRTWLDLDAEGARGLVEDTAQLARMEGLEGHARAAERRGRGSKRT